MSGLYQTITLADGSFVGAPILLPANLVGLDDATLAHLGTAVAPPPQGFANRGLYRLVLIDPVFDPEGETPTDLPDLSSRVADPAAGTVSALRTKRALTPEEISARNPVPTTISDRQFAQVLALDGVVTQDEALAWAARGELPPAMEEALTHVPEEGNQRFAARMLLSAATLYERAHPLVPMLGALLGYDAAAFDDVWRRGAAL